MLAKLGTSEEEADESQYWIELLRGMHGVDNVEANRLHQEIDEIVAILVASKKTLRRRIETAGNRPR